MMGTREFLIRCARIHGNDTFYRQLAAQTAHLPWSDVPNMDRATSNGLWSASFCLYWRTPLCPLSHW